LKLQVVRIYNNNSVQITDKAAQVVANNVLQSHRDICVLARHSTTKRK